MGGNPGLAEIETVEDYEIGDTDSLRSKDSCLLELSSPFGWDPCSEAPRLPANEAARQLPDNNIDGMSYEVIYENSSPAAAPPSLRQRAPPPLRQRVEKRAPTPPSDDQLRIEHKRALLSQSRTDLEAMQKQ